MLETIVTDVVDALADAGISAFAAYPMSPAQRGSEPFICVSMKSAERSALGFSGYLGTRTDENGAVSEVYAMSCDIVLGLEVYAPAALGQGACVSCFDAAAEAADGISDGLKIRGLVCGEATPDPKSGMLKCPCQIHAQAVLTAESGGETGEFTDFVLRGVLRQHRTTA